MEIKLTGTGAIWSRYQSASALINGNIMIDMPNGIFKSLMTEDNSRDKIDHVILTHMHGDHILDLPVWALSKVKFKLPVVKPAIYTHADNVEWLKYLMTGCFNESLRESVIEEYFRFETAEEFFIGDLEVRRIPVSHGHMQAFGYMIREGDKVVSISGDTGMCEALEMMAASSDVLICDACRIETNGKHTGVDEVCSLAARYPDCRIITTHMGDDAREEYKRREGGNLITGYDGMICFI